MTNPKNLEALIERLLMCAADAAGAPSGTKISNLLTACDAYADANAAWAGMSAEEVKNDIRDSVTALGRDGEGVDSEDVDLAQEALFIRADLWASNLERQRAEWPTRGRQADDLRSLIALARQANPAEGWPDDALSLAVKFHETYERLAPSFGYATRQETRTFDPTTPNGRLMVAVCAALLAAGRPPEREGELARLKIALGRLADDQLGGVASMRHFAHEALLEPHGGCKGCNMPGGQHSRWCSLSFALPPDPVPSSAEESQ